MSRDWRRPLKVLDTEPGKDVFFLNGRFFRSTKVIYDRESTERIRSGYACANCMEVFETPWPLRCPTCQAPVREKQLEYFTKEYAGIENLGPHTPMFDGGIHERAAKEEERKHGR